MQFGRDYKIIYREDIDEIHKVTDSSPDSVTCWNLRNTWRLKLWRFLVFILASVVGIVWHNNEPRTAPEPCIVIHTIRHCVEIGFLKNCLRVTERESLRGVILNLTLFGFAIYVTEDLLNNTGYRVYIYNAFMILSKFGLLFAFMRTNLVS